MATDRIVRPESVENAQEKCPGFCYKGGKNASTWITYKRRRGRPEGSKSVKSEIEQKPTLIGSSSYSKGDRDANFKPRTPPPTRKRGRQTRSKSAKSKVEQQKPMWVDTTNNNSSEGTASDRAMELKKKLRAEGPSFVKHMKPSHVDRVFWLGLPAEFCRKHLPTDEVDIVLEDEGGRTFHTNYKADKTALSGGWAGFAKQHRLKVGDALVFHLVRPERFKVYILRENRLTTTGSDKQVASKEATRGGIRSPGPGSDDDFAAAMKSFEDNFKAVVGDGMVEALPDGVRETYYGLCRARKAFLHGRQTSSPALAREMIVETAKIAEGIRACDSGSLEDLRMWKKTLESLESRGMDVAFLRQRVDDLLGLIGAPPSASVEPEWFAYKQLKLIRADAVKQHRTIKSTMSSLKHTLNEIDAEMEEMVQASMNKKEQAMCM